MDVNPINYKLTFEPDLKKFTFNGVESISADCKKYTNVITMHCAELKITSCQVKSKGKIIKSSPKSLMRKKKNWILNYLKKSKEESLLTWNFKEF